MSWFDSLRTNLFWCCSVFFWFIEIVTQLIFGLNSIWSVRCTFFLLLWKFLKPDFLPTTWGLYSSRYFWREFLNNVLVITFFSFLLFFLSSWSFAELMMQTATYLSLFIDFGFCLNALLDFFTEHYLFWIVGEGNILVNGGIS